MMLNWTLINILVVLYIIIGILYNFLMGAFGEEIINILDKLFNIKEK